MPEFTERVHRVTAELQQLLAELDRAAQGTASAEYRERIHRELLTPGVINDFKSAVDDMRLMLWTYMSSRTNGPDMSLLSVEARLQSVRMQRVTEMLKTLQPSVTSETTAALPEASGFFSMIQDIANTAVDRHKDT
jgi:hypothetical protein